MIHGLYLKIEKITDKLINEKKCMTEQWKYELTQKIARDFEKYLLLETDEEREQYKREQFDEYDKHKDEADEAMDIWVRASELYGAPIYGLDSYISKVIPFGEDKGKFEYYDIREAKKYHDFIKKCFAILPRDNITQRIDKTGVYYESEQKRAKIFEKYLLLETDKEREQYKRELFFDYDKNKGMGDYVMNKCVQAYELYDASCYGYKHISKNIPLTGVYLETLLSDKLCTQEEKNRQRLVIYRFFVIAFIARVGHIIEYKKDDGEMSYAFVLKEPIETTFYEKYTM